MVYLEPATQRSFVQVIEGGRLNRPAAELLSMYPYCVVTGCKREPGSTLRYDAIETDKLPLYLEQIGGDFFVVACFPSRTWEDATSLQSNLQEVTEAALVANFGELQGF